MYKCSICGQSSRMQPPSGSCPMCGKVNTYIPVSDPIKSTGQAKDGICWVATAYYGDASHPTVNYLRDYRQHMLSDEKFSPLMSIINSVYHKIGATEFGAWWATSVKRGRVSCWQRYVSGSILRLLLSHARRIEDRNNRLRK